LRKRFYLGVILGCAAGGWDVLIAGSGLAPQAHL
jgi:hypothetical protein